MSTHKITIQNHTGYTINNIHLSPVGHDTWEEDILEDDTLARNESTVVTLPDAEAKWDLKLVFHDGEEETWNDLTLKAGATVTLKYDEEGDAIAEFD